MKKFFQDFKEFAMKGNVLDMAVGVVIGAAFKEIINALVNNIITPFIVLLTGEHSLEALKWVLKDEVKDAAGEVISPAVAVEYGIFLQAIIDFIIIAFCIFVVLRIMMNAQKKLEELRRLNSKAEEEEEEEAPAEPEEDELSVLKEIRDMLVEGKKEE